ncbi:MAG: hypothetical protein ABS95_02840 [Verrucomicrobia bacterium SCN 57-15]|nr:MAG: hypothetical protein ABS95_02840 [Verrucomicrobia bacterium SCN 57-15]
MKTNNNLLAPLGVGFFIGAITIGTIVLVWNHDREPVRYSTVSAPAPVASTTSPASPVLDSSALSRLTTTVASGIDPAVARVAARFICSCGTCGEKRLDVCSCETAQQERAFIQEQLRNGRSEEDAAQALKQKYGGLKS